MRRENMHNKIYVSTSKLDAVAATSNMSGFVLKSFITVYHRREEKSIGQQY